VTNTPHTARMENSRDFILRMLRIFGTSVHHAAMVHLRIGVHEIHERVYPSGRAAKRARNQSHAARVCFSMCPTYAIMAVDSYFLFS
jgi:hypothetical protein